MAKSTDRSEDSSTRYDSNNDSHTVSQDPTVQQWKLHVGVRRRRTAYAGRRERVYAAEARGAERGAAEPADSPESVDETSPPTSMTTKSTTPTLQSKTHEDTSTYKSTTITTSNNATQGLEDDDVAKSGTSSSFTTNDLENLPKRKASSQWIDPSNKERRAVKSRYDPPAILEEKTSYHSAGGKKNSSTDDFCLSNRSSKTVDNEDAHMTSHAFQRSFSHPTKKESTRREEFLPPEPPLRQRPISSHKLLQPLRPLQQYDNENMSLTIPLQTKIMKQGQDYFQTTSLQGQTGKELQPSTTSESLLHRQYPKGYRVTPRPKFTAHERMEKKGTQSSLMTVTEIAKKNRSSMQPQQRLALNSPPGKSATTWRESSRSTHLKVLDTYSSPNLQKEDVHHDGSDTSSTKQKQRSCDMMAVTEVRSNIHSKKRKANEADLQEAKATLFLESETCETGGDATYTGDHTTGKVVSNISRPLCRKSKSIVEEVTNKKEIDFLLSEEESTLTLIEGLSSLNPNVGRDPSGNHLSKSILDHHLPIEWPITGRLQEIPLPCLPGKWKAKIMLEPGVSFSPEPNAGRDKEGDIATLRGYRICLRHETWSDVGPLPTETQDKGNQRFRPIKNNPPDVPDSIRLTSIYPHQSREQEVFGRQLETSEKLYPNSLIGSLTIVRSGELGPCHSSNFESSSVINGVLQLVKQQCSESEGHFQMTKDDYPWMFEVFEEGPKNEDSDAVGFSIPVGLPLDAKYYLRCAQDVAMRRQPTVALDFIFNSTLYAEEMATASLVKEDRKKFAALTRENLKEHTNKIGLFSPVESLCGRSSINATNSREIAVEECKKRQIVCESEPSDRQSDFAVEESQDFSLFSRESWTKDGPPPPNPNVFILPHSGSRASTPEPKFLVEQFDAQISPQNVIPTKTKQIPPKTTYKTDDHEGRTMSMEKTFKMQNEWSLKMHRSNRKSKSLDERTRLASLQSSTVHRNSGRQPSKSKEEREKHPLDSFDSWDDDWDGSSLGESDEQHDAFDFDGELKLSCDDSLIRFNAANSQGEGKLRPKAIAERNGQSGHYAVDRWCGVESGRSDLAISRAIKTTTNASQGHFRKMEVVSTKRRINLVAILTWVPIFSLLFLFGKRYKDTAVPLYSEIAVTRQKKKSLPPPVRLMNKNPKSFRLDEITF
ncbi:hypothetical protein IV203_020715 [Nitzschia inconspicua]|uniref:Uncharacterized protein n=1 Tax=Nitzschia inconspicua TaxID=303405 RepID=A0A9K3KG77_9STRA|nr:hypothetical protein IV203_021595 [Nitzschia inconspicua]KAG7342771.1 hypothetical protein IV203_020715 [Nitzschia inconspicua]